jgi:pantothenate kinase
MKGAPETYDVRALCAAVEQLKHHGTATWPRYDRNIHDPVPDAITVTAPVVVIEGNWVLLDEPNWRDLRAMADLSIFLEADEALVRERLIRRKARGGYTLPEVEAHYERSDKPNIERVLSRCLPANITLRWNTDDQDERITMSGIVAKRVAKEEKNE